ncbi:uncharacterized protein LDX57_010376 [Aspergillus melleus]|uniref:uncharacterized protein n=1 Tax=Aspergillus melleus TaxID=138277 RepID=UPI001E8E4107|nr:uncharacterized protein LDX57_010376 [Aspergillus melleus]KAH8432750.1 hypothetical protein LDX57_010376 [Aspergillus melleus]
MQNRGGQKNAQGYDKIALLFARDPGCSVFRRFDEFSAKNLLYYQAQIANFEEDFHEIIADDKASGGKDSPYYPFSVRCLQESMKSTKPEDRAQWSKFLEGRELVESYYRALIQYKELLTFDSPNETDRTNYQQWLAHQSVKGDVYFATCAEMDIYNSKNNHDMITVSNKEQGADKMTRWIFERSSEWFQGRCGRHFEEEHDIEGFNEEEDVIEGINKDEYDIKKFRVRHYSDKKIRSFTYVVTVVVAAVLPASCMIVLYFVKDTAGRILTVIVYNILFSMFLGLLVRARRVEIFAAVSAFTAIQVTLITNS